MRNWTRSILLSLLLAGLCFAPPSKPIRGVQISRTHRLAKNLVGCWLMNEGAGATIKDLTGRGNDGVFSGNGESWGSGINGLALDFNGTDGQEISCGGNFGEVGSKGLSVVVLFKQRLRNDNAILVTKNVYASSFRFYISTSGTLTWQPHHQSGYVSDCTFGMNSPINYINQWCHVVGTYNADACLLYFNGRLVDSGTCDGDWVTNTDELSIGGQNSFYEFEGLIDHIYYYNRVLSPAEVASLCNDPYQIFEAGPPQYYVAAGAPPSEPERPQIIFIGVAPLTILLASLAFASCNRKAV